MKNQIEVLDKWINIMLHTIRDKKLAPTYTGRFLYLVSTIIYYSNLCFRPRSSKLSEIELKVLDMNELRISVFDFVICESMKYLYDKLNYPKTELVAQDPNVKLTYLINKVIKNLKRFIDRRDNDGWRDSNIQPSFPNGTEFIDTMHVQDLSSTLVEHHKWTPLKNKDATSAQKYLTPGWGEVIPCENISISKYIQIADENFLENERSREIQEVVKSYANLTDNQSMIAEYFQGGQVSPPGIWNIYALYTIISTNMKPAIATEFFYLLNKSLFMASVVAWNVKRKYMQARPIQEIRLLESQQVTNFDGNQVNNNIWIPFQQINNLTPPFPDYISGHSTFSSAAAVIFDKYFPRAFSSINFIPFSNEHGTMITSLLEDNEYENTVKVAMIKINTSSVYDSSVSTLKFPACAVKLTFNTWRELANLSGISRIYGGIHGNNANNAGLIIGEIIGNDILNL